MIEILCTYFLSYDSDAFMLLYVKVRTPLRRAWLTPALRTAVQTEGGYSPSRGRSRSVDDGIITPDLKALELDEAIAEAEGESSSPEGEVNHRSRTLNGNVHASICHKCGSAIAAQWGRGRPATSVKEKLVCYQITPPSLPLTHGVFNWTSWFCSYLQDYVFTHTTLVIFQEKCMLSVTTGHISAYLNDIVLTYRIIYVIIIQRYDFCLMILFLSSLCFRALLQDFHHNLNVFVSLASSRVGGKGRNRVELMLRCYSCIVFNIW